MPRFCHHDTRGPPSIFLAQKTGTIADFPIRHRGSAYHITQNWRATPLLSLLIVIELIANTTTKTGLKIRCELDSNTYPKGIKVSDAEMATLDMTRNSYHPEWNYSISPRFHEMKQ